MKQRNLKNLQWIKAGIVCLYIGMLGFIFSLQCVPNIWMKNGNSAVDSSVFRTMGMLMSKGLIPYRDSFDHKGPLIYILNWLGMEISYWRGIWLIELLTIIVSFGIIYKIARLVCGRLYSCLTLLIVSSAWFKFFEKGNLVEEYAVPFIAAALYIFIDYFINDKINRIRLIICGFSFGAVCLLRVNMIPVWIVFCIAVLVKAICRKEMKKIVFFLSYFVIGVMVIVLPIFIWLAWNHAFSEFWKDYIIFNQMYVADNGEKGQYKTFSHFLNDTLILVALLSIIGGLKKKKDLYHFAYLICYFLTLIMISMSGLAFNHYGMILVPVMAYPIAELLESWKENEKNFSFVLIYLVAVIALPVWIGGLDWAVECYEERNSLEKINTVEKVVDLVERITEEDDVITVWGNWNIIYVLSHRMPASKFSYQNPIGDTDNTIYTEYFEELENRLPKCIVIEPNKEWGRMEEFINAHTEYECMGIVDEIMVYGK